MKNIFTTAKLLICCISLFTIVGCDSNFDNNNVPEPGVSLGLESVTNLRDMGGYTTYNGSVVKRELIYRSNELYQVTPDDMIEVEALNLQTIFDLRKNGERQDEPDEVPAGANYVVLNVLAGMPEEETSEEGNILDDPEKANAILGNGKLEEQVEAVYSKVISIPSSKKAFGSLFSALCDENQTPALFHCKTGKDRTGWAAAAFLSILGVPRDVIMEDYMRSNEYIIPIYQDIIDSFVERGGEESIVLAIFGVKEEYLNAAFNEMEIKYGNIETYFSEALNIDEEHQELLRQIYLEKQ